MKKKNPHPANHLFYIAKKPRPLLGCEAPTITPVLRPGGGIYSFISFLPRPVLANHIQQTRSQ